VSAAAPYPTPFKGLTPFERDDAPFFFGRASEREIIAANLIASRLTLLYGPSGVGKSSVLNAGVAVDLQRLGSQSPGGRRSPEFGVVVFNSWRDDPLHGLSVRIGEILGNDHGDEDEGDSTGSDLLETLAIWIERLEGPLLIILDQFEEYFQYHEHDDGPRNFADQFGQALNAPDLRVNFLLSLREDAIARLDRFKGKIPNLFENYLRIEHLSRDAARLAIEGPVEQYNAMHGSSDQAIVIEPTLVDEVLDQLAPLHGAGLTDARVGRAAPTVAESTGSRIEAPLLQLVMLRVWNEELSRGSRVLQVSTLHGLGGAKRIIRSHLDDVMQTLSRRDRRAAARVFHYLVTPSGTKIAHSLNDLTEYAGVDATRLRSVVDALSKSDVRVLRSVPSVGKTLDSSRVEIFHDILAAAILDWRERYYRRAVRTRWQTIVGLLTALVLILAGVAITNEGEPVSGAIQLRSVLVPTPTGLADAAFSQDGTKVLTVNSLGAVVVWDSETGEMLAELDQVFGIPGLEAVFTPDGDSILLSDLGIWHWKREHDFPQQPNLEKCSLGDTHIPADGTIFVQQACTGVTWVFDVAAKRWAYRLTGLGGLESHQQLDYVKFSPDARLIAGASSFGRRAFIWRLPDLVDGEAIPMTPILLAPATSIVTQGRIASIALSPDGSLLFVGGEEGTAELWDVARFTRVHVLPRCMCEVTGVSFDQSGSRILMLDGSDAQVLDVSSGQKVLTLSQIGQVNEAAFSADGLWIVTAGDNGTAIVWDARTGEHVATISPHAGPVLSAQFSAGGRMLVTTSQNGTAGLWAFTPPT
jgi:WD40 repeat protein